VTASASPSARVLAKFTRVARRTANAILRSFLVILVVLIAGAPAMGLQSILRNSLITAVPSTLLEGYASVLPGALVLLSFLLLALIFLIVPFIWRRTADPTLLRVTVYAAVQVVSASLALLLPEPAGSAFAILLGGEGTLGWWIWQRRWRGAGVAPSPLTGILKPPIVPGQIWYAFIVGTKENKIRPVLVLNWDKERSGWIVAYFTSQPPKSAEIAEKYLHAEDKQIRGMKRETWVHVSDVRVLGKRAFRSYTGLAPAWLYNAACERADCPPYADARIIEEVSAGEKPSPFEANLMRLLGFKDPAIAPEASLTSDAKTTASFLWRVLWPR